MFSRSTGGEIVEPTGGGTSGMRNQTVCPRGVGLGTDGTTGKRKKEGRPTYRERSGIRRRSLISFTMEETLRRGVREETTIESGVRRPNKFNTKQICREGEPLEILNP